MVPVVKYSGNFNEKYAGNFVRIDLRSLTNGDKY